MKRSEINFLVKSAEGCFARNGWTLPPNPRWDVTDFGLGKWSEHGLVLVNLAEWPEYCEKLMYAQKGMTTPAHCHAKKKEDIICRWGLMEIQLWGCNPEKDGKRCLFSLPVNGELQEFSDGDILPLPAGHRITLTPGIYHRFTPVSYECIIGEVSTANDDANDNFFVNPEIGRYPEVEEDEPALVQLLSDKKGAGK